MKIQRKAAQAGAASVALSTLLLAACSGSSDEEGATAASGTQITYLTWSDELGVNQATALIEAFHDKHPDIEVTLDTYPVGADGDNLIKTRLATDEMADVFLYNSGSLVRALNPDETLVDLSDEDWMSDVHPDFQLAVSGENGTYGAPTGASRAGGIVYNRDVYDELGLTVPESWDEFIANGKVAKEAGVTPVFQAYGDTWTSQLILQGSFANVTAQDPDWADGYTAGTRKYAEAPALEGFTNLAAIAEAGLLNEDYSAATNNDAIAAVAAGEAAHYPMLTNVILNNVRQNFPEAVDSLGIFPVPASDPDNTSMTIWQPNALYIPQTTQGDELAAAKAFVAFMNSPEGCALQNESAPGGPYVIESCELPDDVAPMVNDVQSWVDAGKSGLALGFISPIKGPNLEHILVEVGSGITSAEAGAAAYDADAKKQAQQLGLENW